MARDTGRVASLWRFPIKSHGREGLDAATLTAGQTLPWDRVWAVAHDRSRADGTEWVGCFNFSIGSKAPGLGAITAQLDPQARRITLRHPDLPELTFWPDDNPDALIAWAGPLIPENRAQSVRVVPAPGRGYTDSDFPSVTIGNLTSHRAVEQRLGQPLSIHRWRCNLWLDGLAPWAEFDWIGRDIHIGEAILRPRERTTRCLATHNNPDTGRRDHDVLGALDSWGHRDFTVRAEVIRGGAVRTGDPAEVA